MASLVKTAAVGLAMSRCPFLSSETLQIAAKTSSAIFSAQARQCPVMGQLIAKGVATLPVSHQTPSDEDKPAVTERVVSTSLTNLDSPTQHTPAVPLPPQYSDVLREKIQSKKSDATYREFRVLSRRANNAPYAVAKPGVTDGVKSPDHADCGDGGVIDDDDGGVMVKSPGDKDVSVWCSNDYLGMSYHPRVTGAVVGAIHANGVGAGGTRNIAGTSHHHVALENTLAGLHGKESALVFTSCYVANDTTLQTLAHQLDAEIYSDAGNHASMIAGIKNSRAPKHVFRHNDVAHLEDLLARSDPRRRKIVAFESVYSMTGTMAPLEQVCDLAHKYGAITFVDEVHAVGLYGYHGAGLAEELGIAHKVDIITGTLGKAYGLVGGYIASSSELVDVVRSYGSGLIFTTSLPPSVAAGAVESIRVLYGEEGRVLRRKHRAAYTTLRDTLIREGFPVLECPSHIIPVHIGDANKARLCMELLFEHHNIYVQAINYPTVPRGSELLRFVATPNHDAALLDHLIASLHDVWAKLDLPLLEIK